jgi:peptide chain release factor 2
MIPHDELKSSLYDPRPPGGQQVGLTPTGVKVEHLPTGTIAIVQTNRSQHKNREIAIRMIEAALTDPDFR